MLSSILGASYVLALYLQIPCEAGVRTVTVLAPFFTDEDMEARSRKNDAHRSRPRAAPPVCTACPHSLITLHPGCGVITEKKGRLTEGRDQLKGPSIWESWDSSLGLGGPAKPAPCPEPPVAWPGWSAAGARPALAL